MIDLIQPIYLSNCTHLFIHPPTHTCSVLLLDEATSALDASSEHLVQQAIDRMISMGGMTVLIIAHRLSTIVNANLILVVQAGEVVEQGTHHELMQKVGGVYSQLVSKQVEALDVATASNGNGSSGMAGDGGPTQP